MSAHVSPVPARAWIVLPGHRDAEARLEVMAYPFWTRVLRTLGLAFTWVAITVTTFLVTIFDPFMTAMPALIGTMSVYRSWKGRFRVEAFEGGCPRCGTAMALKRGSRIGTPHHMVCYSCHHEPELHLG